jgi:hypothetical protein
MWYGSFEVLEKVGDNVYLKGQLSRKGKWYSRDKVEEIFPHLNE